MLDGVRVEHERPVGSRKAAVVAGRLHLVGLVQIVQPVPVDEAVLQTDRSDLAAARLEHERAAPAAGLRVGHDDRGRERVDRGAGFVHRADGPRPLQERGSLELGAKNGPEIAPAKHAGGADPVAGRDGA